MIAHKLVNPKLEKTSINIMGIAGLRIRCKGQINNVLINWPHNSMIKK